MTFIEFLDLHFRLNTLTVFRAVLDDPVINALDLCVAQTSTVASLLEEDSEDEDESTPDVAAESYQLSLDYAEFVSLLFASEAKGLSAYVLNAIVDDENVYLRRVGAGQKVAPAMTAAVEAELATFQELSDLMPSDFLDILPSVMADSLPVFDTEHVDLVGTYHDRVTHIGSYGYGMYARYHVFRVDDDGSIVPVHHPDPIRLSDLVDYERERTIILDNTRALVAGLPAANILLTGDAGTGKSSTVKAVVNELAPEGMRILEVRKEQLRSIPAILDELTRNPLKFVIFIDDLSFSNDDDNFAALKAILEGSVSAKSDNVAIYATSNRRHMVKERFSDREGDDVHRNDTMQEIISLSDRFGIRVSFSKPDKATYLDIVHKLADDADIEMDQDELDLLAERFATRRGGRSARGARQFVDSLLSQQQ